MILILWNVHKENFNFPNGMSIKIDCEFMDMTLKAILFLVLKDL